LGPQSGRELEIFETGAENVEAVQKKLAVVLLFLQCIQPSAAQLSWRIRPAQERESEEFNRHQFMVGEARRANASCFRLGEFVEHRQAAATALSGEAWRAAGRIDKKRGAGLRVFEQAAVCTARGLQFRF